nr:gamma aminobutyrate transaminase 1, mitochondrial [Tanacetum cinerariifolium]
MLVRITADSIMMSPPFIITHGEIDEIRGTGLILATEFANNKSPDTSFPPEWALSLGLVDIGLPSGSSYREKIGKFGGKICNSFNLYLRLQLEVSNARFILVSSCTQIVKMTGLAWAWSCMGGTCNRKIDTKIAMPAPSPPWLPFPQPPPHHYATATPSPTSPRHYHGHQSPYVISHRKGLHQEVRLGLGLTAVGAFGLAGNHKGCVWVSRNALRVRLVVQERTKGAFGCEETPTRAIQTSGWCSNVGVRSLREIDIKVIDDAWRRIYVAHAFEINMPPPPA